LFFTLGFYTLAVAIVFAAKVLFHVLLLLFLHGEGASEAACPFVK